MIEATGLGRLVAAGLVEGIMVAGVVKGRTRRRVGDQGREVVDYRILAGSEVYTVSEWEPKEYLPIGLGVALPVRITPYTAASGGAAYRLAVDKGNGGEAF